MSEPKNKPALDELREAVRQVTDYSTGWGRLKEAALRVLSEPPRQLTATREFLEALLNDLESLELHERQWARRGELLAELRRLLDGDTE